MKWNEISIKTTDQGIDVVSALLYDLNVGGIEIVGGDLPENGDWDYIDDDMVKKYDIDGIIIKSYFPDDEVFFDMLRSLKSGLSRLKKQNPDYGDLDLLSETKDESEWSENWKKYFKPFKAGKRIIVCPEWESYNKKDDEIVLKIDPGMAFGSGLHETTKLCIIELEKYVSADSTVIDVGCGSGILAIAAAKLGAKSLLALDRDSVCIKVADENILLNNADDKIISSKADLLNGVDLIKADIIVANIIADIIIRLNKNVKEHLKKSAIYITSGIIKDRLDDVLESLEKQDFDVINVAKMGEWCAITATPKR